MKSFVGEASAISYPKRHWCQILMCWCMLCTCPYQNFGERFCEDRCISWFIQQFYVLYRPRLIWKHSSSRRSVIPLQQQIEPHTQASTWLQRDSPAGTQTMCSHHSAPLGTCSIAWRGWSPEKALCPAHLWVLKIHLHNPAVCWEWMYPATLNTKNSVSSFLFFLF